MDSDKGKVLAKTSGDYVYTASRVALSFIPVIGGGASELLNLIITPPLERRRDELMLKIYNDLLQVKAQVEGFSIEALSKNELFISIMLQAMQFGIKNHQEEKLSALRNAVINTAIETDFDEVELFLFLNMIDDLSVWHLRILQYFRDPIKWFRDKNREKPNNIRLSAIQGLISAYGDLSGKHEFINMITKDLDNRGLLHYKNLTDRTLMYQNRTTEFGNRFLDYIGTPQLLENKQLTLIQQKPDEGSLY